MHTLPAETGARYNIWNIAGGAVSAVSYHPEPLWLSAAPTESLDRRKNRELSVATESAQI